MGDFAKDNWRDFEILAVKVVSLKVKDLFIYDDLIKHDVPLTRDHGIDGHITVVMKNSNMEITVEAKLRSKGKLSLKDFATSVLNYFINLSNIHFIITNVEFSDDAQNVVDKLNESYINRNIQYYDGYDLLKIMQDHDYMQKDYPSIYSSLLQHSFPKKKIKANTGEREVKIQPLTASRKALYNIIKDKLDCNIPLIIVGGEAGTGKTFIIKDALAHSNLNTIDLDMQDTASLRIFAIALVKSIVHVDIFSIIDCLSESEKNEIEQDIDYYSGSLNKCAEYLKQIININMSDEIFGYIMKSFIKEVINRFDEKHILYIHNINKSTYETLTFLLQTLSLFIENNITVIIELPDIMDGFSYMSDLEYSNILKGINILKSEYPLTAEFLVKEFDEEEAMEFLKLLPLPNKHDIFFKAIINKYGYNPSVLFSIADYIKSNNITTMAEIEAMDIYEHGLISPANIYDYLYCKDYQEQLVVTFVLIMTYLLGYKIDLKFIYKMNQKFNMLSVYKILLDTGWFYSSNGFLYLKRYISENTLYQFAMMNDLQDCAKFLLENKSIWSGGTEDRQYLECNLLYITEDNRFLQTADDTLKTLKRIQSNSLVILLLDKCRMFAEKTDMLSSITYSVMYLEALEPEKYSTNDISAIIEETERKCSLLIETNKESNIYEYIIRIKIIYYKKYRSLFNFFEAEKFIDEGLMLENVYNNSALMNRLYVYKALCIKEKGFKDDFLEWFKKGIKKYPKESYIQVCYCSNVSSYNFKRNRKRSRVYLRRGIKCAENNGHRSLAVWLQHNLLICNLYDTNFDYNNFSELHDLRHRSDKVGSIADISRSYNIEGCMLLSSKQYDKAVKCFRNAVNIFDKNVTEQMTFLFKANLIVALSHMNEEISAKLDDVNRWLHSSHERIYTKLKNVPVLKYENNFAAIVSLLKVSVYSKNSAFAEKILDYFPFDEVVNIYSSNKNNYKKLEKELNALVDTCYIKNGDILILF